MGIKTGSSLYFKDNLYSIFKTEIIKLYIRLHIIILLEGIAEFPILDMVTFAVKLINTHLLTHIY